MCEKECPEIQNHTQLPITSENCKILRFQSNNLEAQCLGPVLVLEHPILEWDLPYLLAYQHLNCDGPPKNLHLPWQARIYLQSTVCESQILGPLKKHEETNQGWDCKLLVELLHILQNLEGWKKQPRTINLYDYMKL